MQLPSFLADMKTERSPPYTWPVFWDDVKAGLVLLMVEIPFAMGIGVISGMGVAAALYCMVIVGIIAGILGGTRAMVSGPAVAVAVIVGSALSSGGLGTADMGFVALLAGAIQLALGFAGIGRFMAYLPHVVLTGFVSGIGCLLVWSQAWSVIRLGPADIAIAGICLSTILLWPRRLHAVIPGQLAGIAVGWSASAFLLHDGLQLGPVPAGIPDISVSIPALEILPLTVGPALMIALISSAYTLMIAQSVDTMTGGRHNANRQLAATGVANFAAGLFGAVPGAGQFGAMASVVLGGKTVVAGIVVSVLTAGFVFGLGPYLKTLPVAAILSVVIWIGWELVNWPLIKRLHKAERRHAVVFAATMLFAAAGEPLLAVVLGLIAAFLGNATALERTEMDNVLSAPLLDSTILPESDDVEFLSARTGLLAFRGTFTAASSQRLASLLEGDLREHEIAIFDLSGIAHMDDSAAHLLQLLLGKAATMGIEVIVFGVPDHLRGTFEAFGVMQHVPADRTVNSMEEAQRIAGNLLRNGDPDRQ